MSSCNELGEILGHRNVLYFRAYENQLFHYREEKIIDTAIMKDIGQYGYLLEG